MTMENTRMTNKIALQYAIKVVGDTNPEVVAKLEKMIEAIEKKASTPKKPTAKQEQNEVIKTNIYNFLCANEDKGFTVSELLKLIPSIEGDSNQHISALLRALVQTDKVERYTDKRKTYFKVKLA